MWQCPPPPSLWNFFSLSPVYDQPGPFGERKGERGRERGGRESREREGEREGERERERERKREREREREREEKSEWEREGIERTKLRKPLAYYRKKIKVMNTCHLLDIITPSQMRSTIRQITSKRLVHGSRHMSIAVRKALNKMKLNE